MSWTIDPAAAGCGDEVVVHGGGDFGESWDVYWNFSIVNAFGCLLSMVAGW
jgi:hypothetical protein